MSKIPFIRQINTGDDVNQSLNIENISISVQKEDVKFIPFQLEENYLERTVTDRASGIDRFTLSFDDNEENTLFEFSKKKDRVLLLGGAGNGKSTELKRVYNQYLEQGIYKPFHIDLKHLGDLPIHVIEPNLLVFNASEIIVLLDGLDEPSDINKAIKRIQEFSENTGSNAKYIISCRSNIQPNGLGNYERCFLKELSQSQIRTYLQYYDIDTPDEFIQSVFHKGIYDLIKIPFYLDKILKFFLDNNKKLPNNKIELFRYLIDNSLAIRFNAVDSYSIENEEVKKCRKLLRKLAFYMQCLGKSALLQNDVSDFLSIDEIRFLRKDSSILNVIDNNWSFQHLNFQEYLCADVLSNFPTKKIKKIMGAKIGKRIRFNPNWQNTLSFLVTILEDCNSEKFKQIIDWIKEEDPDVLLAVEPSRLSKTIKSEIFIDILSKHEKEMKRFGFDMHGKLEQLIFFVQTPEAEKLLLSNLRSTNETLEGNGRAIIASAAPNNTSITLQKGLKKEIDKNLKKTGQNIIWALNTANRFGWIDKVECKDFFTRFFDKETMEVKQTLISIACQNGWIDDFFTYYIELLKLKNTSSNDYFVLIDEKSHMKLVKKEESVFLYFELYLDLMSTSEGYEISRIGRSLFEEFDLTMPLEPKLNELICKIVHKEYSWRLQEEDNLSSILLNKYSLWDDALEYVFAQRSEDEYYYSKLAVLTKISNYKVVVGLFVANGIEKEVIEQYQRHLARFDEELLRFFNKEINHHSKISIQLPNFISEASLLLIKKQRKEHLWSLLFNKTEYVKKVEEIFGAASSSNLLALMKEHRDYSKDDVETKRFIIRSLPRNQNIEKKELISHIMEYWDCRYAINRIVDFLLQEQQMPISTEQQIGFIKEWCDDNLLRASFKTATKINGNTTSVNALECRLAFLIDKFKFSDYDESVYLEMLSFAPHIGSQVINTFDIATKVKEIDKEKVRSRVLRNIEGNNLEGMLLKNNLSYCVQNNIKEVTPFLLPYIIEGKTGSLKTYLDLNGEIEAIENLPLVVGNFSYRYHLLRVLIDEKSPNVVRIIQQCFSKETVIENKIDLAKYLIELEEPEGLLFLRDEIKRTNKNLLNFNRIRKNSFSNHNMVEAFLRLVKLGFYTNIDQEIINLYYYGFNGLYTIVMNNRDKFNSIWSRVKLFLFKEKIKCYYQLKLKGISEPMERWNTFAKKIDELLFDYSITREIPLTQIDNWYRLSNV